MAFEAADVDDNGRFEAEFIYPKLTRLSDGTNVHVRDFPAPESAESSHRPVFLAPAWSATADVYKDTLRTFVQGKRRVLTLNQPREGGDVTFTDEDFMAIPEARREKVRTLLAAIPQEEIRKAKVFVESMDATGVNGMDAVAHSEGFVWICAAALMRPDLFHSVVSAGGAGLIGKDTMAGLITRFFKQTFVRPKYSPPTDLPALSKVVAKERRAAIARGEMPAETPHTKETVFAQLSAAREAAAKRGITELVSPDAAEQVRIDKITRESKLAGREHRRDAGTQRVLDEVKALSNVDLEPIIRELCSLGINVGLMVNDQDPVFKERRVRERFGTKEFQDLGVIISSAPGDHRTFPRRNFAAKAALSLLAIFDERERRSGTGA